jgi:hypothetical protein
VFFGPGLLEVKDSIVRGNSTGIAITGSAGAAQAAIDHVRLEANSAMGLLAIQGSTVTGTSCIASGNGTGYAASSGSAASVDLNIESCVASNNLDGITSQTSSTVIATFRVSNSTVTNNTLFGLVGPGGPPGFLLSRGNNTVARNGQDIIGTVGSYGAQ